MKLKENLLDVEIENAAEAIELQQIAETIMLKGKIPWDHALIELWVEKNELTESQRLLMVSSVLPQRLLLATANYWKDNYQRIFNEIAERSNLVKPLSI